MEVMLPSHDNFNFDSACSSPYAPSTPKRFGEPNFYFSAPSSPTRASALYRDFNNFSFNSSRRGNSSVIPYDWEEKPGTPKAQKPQNEEQDEEIPVVSVEDEESYDFEFGFSGQFDKDDTSSIIDADELFDGGKIKPLKPPPRLHLTNDFRPQKSNLSSPKSPRSPIAQGKKMIREAFSPKNRRKQVVDPFAVAIKGVILEQPQERGRERVYSNFSSASRKGSRSLSPYRSPPTFELPNQTHQHNTTTTTTSTTTKATKSSSRKWSFRDFLLFRSASEGRAADRDPLRKFSLIKRHNGGDEVKSSSFRSTDSSGSGSGSMRRGRVSAHEQHYRSNRAVAEEMKRKTVLPYKQGLFGWFRI